MVSKERNILKKMHFFDIFPPNFSFAFIKDILIPYRKAVDCQKSARIKFNIELFSDSVRDILYLIFKVLNRPLK